MEKFKSTVETLELTNGDEVTLTLNFYKLQLLKADKNTRRYYDKAMEAMSNKKADFVDYADIFYAAYLCANDEPKYSRSDFLTLIPFDFNIVGELVENLLTSKKK